MLTNLQDSTILNNGVKMPWLGLGVYKAKAGHEVTGAVRAALRAGYRSIDTAAFYNNEEGVGLAIRESGLSRDELFITTKVWNSDQGYESTLAAFESSRRKLGLDVIDLYLVHWPIKGKYKDTWKALEKLHREGAIRAIGVSNFQAHHLRDVMADSDFVPAVNQVEYHPLLQQQELLTFCREHRIQLEAWSPLMQGVHLNHPILAELAAKHGKTPAQIVIRWDLQNGVVTIPKSVTESRILENADVFDFELSADDMAKITSMNVKRRLGADPDNLESHNFNS
jgi:diketogulonate reductase-like aldo/keto reductase